MADYRQLVRGRAPEKFTSSINWDKGTNQVHNDEISFHFARLSTELQRHDISLSGREAIQVRIDFPRGSKFGKHTHPGEEVIYVLEGLFKYEMEGKPPVTLKSGDVLFIPAGTIHSAKNVGTTKAAELATYIVEKGKQLVVSVK